MKVAFVRNPKTGSSSMMRALADTPGIVNQAHNPAWSYGDLPSFAFVRNPWERCHSWWRHQNYCKTETFRDYVVKRAASEIYFHGRQNTGLSINDQRIWTEGVTLLGTFENLEADFLRITGHFGLEAAPLPHRNLSIRRDKYPYRPSLWDEEMLKAVRPLFEPFARNHGYMEPS